MSHLFSREMLHYVVLCCSLKRIRRCVGIFGWQHSQNISRIISIWPKTDHVEGKRVCDIKTAEGMRF